MQVELKGKRALITGGSSGIGFEVAKGLLRLNAAVVITGRDKDKLALAKDYLQKDTGKSQIETVQADFIRLSSARALIKDIDALDILVNNAGFIRTSRELTEDGFEAQWQVNYLVPALLSLSLKDRVGPGGRMVNVASGAHKRAQLDLSDPGFVNRPYSALKAYGQSKLALIMLTSHLGRAWDVKDVAINAVHPGIVRTGFARDAGALEFMFNLFKPFYKSPRNGARGVLSAACSPFNEDVTGRYFYGSRPTRPAKQARDKDKAAQLYDETIKALCL